MGGVRNRECYRVTSSGSNNGVCPRLGAEGFVRLNRTIVRFNRIVRRRVVSLSLNSPLESHAACLFPESCVPEFHINFLLRAAQGWIELGLPHEAWAELQQVPAEAQHRLEVMLLSLDTLQTLKQWR